MKTYNQYLDIIKKIEWDEQAEERERAKKWQEENPAAFQVNAISTSKMTFDYSVEIMGMMMQDFINETKDLYPFQFDKDGNLKTV